LQHQIANIYDNSLIQITVILQARLESSSNFSLKMLKSTLSLR
jgi:hypothetical protein